MASSNPLATPTVRTRYPVNCEQLRDRLLEGSSPETPELCAHAADCDACRELLAAQSLVAALRTASPNPGRDLSQLQQAVRGQLARETGPSARLKGLPTRARLGLALALIAAITAVEGTLLARADMHLVPTEHLLALLATPAALAVAASWVALRPLFRGALPRWLELGLPAVCLAAPVVLSFVQPETGHPVTPGRGGFGGCLLHGLTLAALVWLGFRALDRRSLTSGLGALTAGMAGAVVATLGLQLHCVIPAAPHWLFGHAGVGVAVLVALWIRHVLSSRR